MIDRWTVDISSKFRTSKPGDLGNEYLNLLVIYSQMDKKFAPACSVNGSKITKE